MLFVKKDLRTREIVILTDTFFLQLPSSAYLRVKEITNKFEFSFFVQRALKEFFLTKIFK